MTLRRLAIVCYEDPRRVTGGVQRRVEAEIRHFTREGVEVVVLTEGTQPEATDGRVRYITVPTPRVPYPARTLLFSLGAAARLSKLRGVDLVETHHDAGIAALTAGAIARSPLPHVEVVHGVFRDELLAMLRGKRLLSPGNLSALGLAPLSLAEELSCRRAAGVVAVSRYAAETITRRYHVPSQRIRIIPNGIDSRWLEAANARDEVRPSNETVNLLYVGRLHARKGVSHLMRAFAEAYRIEPRLRLRIAGDGPLRESLEENSRASGTASAVRFLGSVSDPELHSLYREADVLCMPSLQEGQGIAALEAQAAGTPVIATWAGGLPDVVRNGQTGLLVAPGDAPSLKDAILRLAASPDLRRQFGQNATRWAAAFTWDTTLAPCRDWYEDLADGAARRVTGRTPDARPERLSTGV